MKMQPAVAICEHHEIAWEAVWSDAVFARPGGVWVGLQSNAQGNWLGLFIGAEDPAGDAPAAWMEARSALSNGKSETKT